MIKDFDSWNSLKHKIDLKSREEVQPDGTIIGLYAHPREIWWFSTGVNVGSEIDGKNDLFERPGIILKVHNQFTSTIIPISSNKPESYYSYNFPFNNIQQSAILSQAKLIDHKRLTRKIGTLDDAYFHKLKKKFVKYFQYETPLARGISEAEAISGLSISLTQNLSTQKLDLSFVYPTGQNQWQIGVRHDDREGVCCIIKFRDENKYVYLQYLDWEKESCFVTGGLEHNESLEDCVKREILEETGYTDVGNIKNLGVLNTNFFLVQKQHNIKYKMNLFEVELNSDKNVGVSEEEAKHAEVRFCKKEELLNKVSLLDMQYLIKEYFKMYDN